MADQRQDPDEAARPIQALLARAMPDLRLVDSNTRTRPDGRPDLRIVRDTPDDAA